ncbi:unnamed protein product [Dibothriocephalus latus]|uniref:Uncharacterized protein n=1 Tax=Dibothriocephalus latus TaxID=60516 RepID=A0A3P7PSP6_DIBLA|nr:unnamed protein product [Dibothriocephalus latus]
MVRQLHNGMTTSLTENWMDSEASAVTNGMKQNCVPASHLVSSAMPMDVYCNDRPGIRIAYRNYGHLLISRRMQAPKLVSTACSLWMTAH